MLKNIIAFGAGICDGLGLGDNSKAALMTRGIREISRLGVAMGADTTIILFDTASSKEVVTIILFGNNTPGK